MLRRIFGTKREEVAGSWRIVHKEGLHKLYASTNISRVVILRRMGWVGHVACMGEMRNIYKILIGEPEGNRLLRRPGYRWEDNIRMDLKE